MAERRTFIGLLVLLTGIMLAGCAEPAGRLQMDAVNDIEIADRASRSINALAERNADRIVPAAVGNGSTTANGEQPPIREGLPFAYNGSYYTLSWTVVDASEAISLSLSTNYTVAEVDASRIAYSELPGPDRRVADELFPRRQRFPDGTEPEQTVRFGASAVYNASQQNVSVFFPAPQYDAIIYNGTAYEIRVEEPRRVTVRTYRYTAKHVASSPATYADQLRDRYRFTLTGLSDAERSVVTTAIDDGYYADGEDDDAFAAVLKRFRQKPAVQRDEANGDWLVQYKGVTYWAELSFYGFTDS